MILLAYKPIKAEWKLDIHFMLWIQKNEAHNINKKF